MISLSHRWCWSPPYTWLSQSTAAAASSPPLPLVRFQSRQQAGGCRSPVTASGARRWWAVLPPTAQVDSAPAPKAEDSPAGVQVRSDRSGERRQREARGLNQLSMTSSSPILTLQFKTPRWLQRARQHNVFWHVTVFIVFNHHCCHYFATVHLHTGQLERPNDLRECKIKWWTQWDTYMNKQEFKYLKQSIWILLL